MTAMIVAVFKIKVMDSDDIISIIFFVIFLFFSSLFFFVTLYRFFIFFIKPTKKVFFSYNEQGLRIENQFYPYEDIKAISYGLDFSHPDTKFWQGFKIELKSGTKVVVPTWQVFLDKEVKKILEPLHTKVPLHNEDEEHENNV